MNNNERQLIEWAKGLGVDVSLCEVTETLTADAPLGQVFKGTGTHYVVACLMVNESQYDGDSRTYASKQCVQSIRDDINGGFEPCPEKDCDICLENREALTDATQT